MRYEKHVMNIISWLFRIFLQLKFSMKLMHIKVLIGWSNKSFDMLLKLLKATVPSGTTILDLWESCIVCYLVVNARFHNSSIYIMLGSTNVTNNEHLG